MKLASEACGCAQTSLYLLVNAGIKQSGCFMVRLTVLCTYKLKFFFFLTIFFPFFFLVSWCLVLACVECDRREEDAGSRSQAEGLESF